jgi:hypothetical protein
VTLEIAIPAAIAPFIVAALVDHVTCPKCGEQTDNVTENRRLVCGSPAWPCRPCRAATERGRGRTRLCSVGRCKARPPDRQRFCAQHAPRFG